MIMESSINGKWIIPFKKFGMVRVNMRYLAGNTFKLMIYFLFSSILEGNRE